MSQDFNAPATIVQWPVGASAIRKGQLVKLSTGALVPCSSQGEAAVGVALEDAAASRSQPLSVCVIGECDIEVDDATIAKNSFLTPKTTGVAEVAAASDVVAARALEAGYAAVSGQFAYIRCYVLCGLAPYSIGA